MTLHIAQPADRPRPSRWVRVAAWFAVLVLLCGSVAEAAHLHRLTPQQGAATGHTATVNAADGDSGTNCLLCLLNGSAVPVHAWGSAPQFYRAHVALRTYSSRSVPLLIPFALSNRPPPTA